MQKHCGNRFLKRFPTKHLQSKDAVSNAIKAYTDVDFTVMTYTEHALEVRSNSKAVSYVGLEKDGTMHWGVGVHSDIINSSISALVSAWNRMAEQK